MSIDEVRNGLENLRVVDSRFSWHILIQKIAVAALVATALVYLLPMIPALGVLNEPLWLFVVAIITSIINDLQSYFGIKQDGAALVLKEDEDI